MRRKIIIANWKMYLSTRESIFLASKLRSVKTDNQVILAPSFTAIHPIAKIIKGDGLGLAAQNISHKKYGARTGEVSALDIKELGCEYVILGHSERRKYFKETYELVNKKLKYAQKAGLVPILCVGENLRERRSGHAWRVIKNQLSTALKGVNKKKLLIAYEPIRAIGTGNAEDPEDANKIHVQIKKEIKNAIKVLYGGGVNSNNFDAFLIEDNIDGFLVGGASTRFEEFKKIIVT